MSYKKLEKYVKDFEICPFCSQTISEKEIEKHCENCTAFLEFVVKITVESYLEAMTGKSVEGVSVEKSNI